MQNQDLKRQLVLGHDKQLEALQLRNDQLNEAVKSLEEELSRRMNDQVTLLYCLLEQHTAILKSVEH